MAFEIGFTCFDKRMHPCELKVGASECFISKLRFDILFKDNLSNLVLPYFSSISHPIQNFLIFYIPFINFPWYYVFMEWAWYAEYY